MAELSMPFRRTIQMIVKRCSCDNCGWQKISKERKVHFCRNCSNARHFNTMNKKIGMQEVLINIIHCCHCGIIFVETRMWLCRDLTEKLDDAGFWSRSQPVSSLSLVFLLLLLFLLLMLTEKPDNAGSQSQFQPVSWLALWLSLLLSLLLTLIEILDKAASQSRSRIFIVAPLAHPLKSNPVAVHWGQGWKQSKARGKNLRRTAFCSSVFSPKQARPWLSRPGWDTECLLLWPTSFLCSWLDGLTCGRKKQLNSLQPQNKTVNAYFSFSESWWMRSPFMNLQYVSLCWKVNVIHGIHYTWHLNTSKHQKPLENTGHKLSEENPPQFSHFSASFLLLAPHSRKTQRQGSVWKPHPD